MSNQSEAKKNQSWKKKPVFPVCSNCPNFTYDTVTEKTNFGSYTVDKNLRCSKGEFKTSKTNCCDEHPVLKMLKISVEDLDPVV